MRYLVTIQAVVHVDSSSEAAAFGWKVVTELERRKGVSVGTVKAVEKA